MNYTIPVYQPDLSGNEKKYVNQCLDSSWISSKGQFINEFESKFASYTGVKHAVTVSNGTVALHLALLALGIEAGDEVIVPAFTYIASINAIRYVGATPVFVDIEPSSWQIDCKDVAAKITSRTKAIMAVHLYGCPCDMVQLSELALARSLRLIEDCAEAFGSRIGEQHVGTFSDVATYSFFGNKTITTGEGGMVVTNNPILDKKIRHLKGQGLMDGREYWHDIVGYNYRMTNICAAIGLAQLERADSILQRKRWVADFYKNHLWELPLQFQKEQQDTFHSWWMFSVLTENQQVRDELRRHLAQAGIETRPLFFPAHQMPMYEKSEAQLKVSESLAPRGLNLPSWPTLSEDQLIYITNIITDFYRHD